MKPGQDSLQQALQLHQNGRLADAEAFYEQALAANPAYLQAHHLLGVLRLQLRKPDQALPHLQHAVNAAPENHSYRVYLGTALSDLRHYNDALVHFDRALEMDSSAAIAWQRRGDALFHLGQRQEAITSYDKALALKPTAEAHNNRGTILFALRSLPQALQSFDAALSLDPTLAAAHNNRGNALRDLKRIDAAMQSYKKAIELAPTYAEALVNLGNLLVKERRYSEGVQQLSQAYALHPDFKYLAGYLLHAKMLCCDWTNYASLLADIEAGLDEGRKVAEPFGYQAVATSPMRLRTCAEIFAADFYPAQPVIAPALVTHEKIRVGYVSGEFRDQATSILMTEVYERHDKERFEVIAFDNGWDDGSILRGRMNRAFQHIIDISAMSDQDAGVEVRRMGIDILVNLNGYFGDNRPGLFALKPAPIQVNYLGFPGTLGASYMDYIIGDETITPRSEQNAYTESVVYMPDSYQANDSQRVISREQVTRDAANLPEDRFVFCCFNNNYKITPDTFACWMRILQRADNAVLWLLEDNPLAGQNLRRAAAHAGISPDRIVFAPRMLPAQHLARHRLADLFIDTLPYNAHTTASDALWAGLPLLTCLGSTFPGRVSASLLKALDMPELITTSLQEFEDTACALAQNPARITQLKNKLGQNRISAALFDSKRFTQHLEDAYAEMHRRWVNAEQPSMIVVPPRSS